MGIGFYFHRPTGRRRGSPRPAVRCPAGCAGCSIFATFLSSISFLAIPGGAYATNWNWFVFSLSLPIATWVAVRWFMPYYRASSILGGFGPSLAEPTLGRADLRHGDQPAELWHRPELYPALHRLVVRPRGPPERLAGRTVVPSGQHHFPADRHDAVRLVPDAPGGLVDWGRRGSCKREAPTGEPWASSGDASPCTHTGLCDWRACPPILRGRARLCLAVSRLASGQVPGPVSG